MSNTPISKLEKIKQILPPNHPLIQMLEGNFKPVEKSQKLEKLKQILPPNHPLILKMDGNK